MKLCVSSVGDEVTITANTIEVYCLHSFFFLKIYLLID